MSTWLAVRATHAEGVAQDRLAGERQALAETRDAQQKEADARRQAVGDRDRALSAEERAKDALAGSLFEQARAVRLAGRSGRRWEALGLLERAETLRGRERKTTAARRVSEDRKIVARRVSEDERQALPERDRKKAPETLQTELPTRAELRTEAVAALLEPDARVTREFGGMYQVVDPSGGFAGLMEFKLGDGNQPGFGVRVIELATGKQTADLDLGKASLGLGTTSFALGPQGKLIALSEPERIRLIDVHSGRDAAALAWPPTPEERGPRGRVLSTLTWVEFSPDGRFVAAFRVAASRGEVVLWELPEDADGKDEKQEGLKIRPVKGRQLATTRELAVVSPNFSADSQRLAYPSTEQGVAIWNLKKKEVELEIELPKTKRPFGPLGFAPDGRSLAIVCVSGAVIVWDLKTNAQAHEITAGKTSFRNVWIAPPRISPDNRRLITGTVQGEIAVFRLDEEREEQRLDHGAAVRLVGWHDNDRMWSAGASAMKEWQLAVDRPVRKLDVTSSEKSAASRLTFSRDGRWMAVAAGGGRVHVFRRPAGELHRTLETPCKTLLSLNLGATGDHAVVTGLPHAGQQSQAGFAELGLLRTVVAAYNLETGEELFREDAGNCMSTGVTDDGRAILLKLQGPNVLVTQQGREEPVWESSGKIRPGVQRAAAISADGRRLATWSFTFRQGDSDGSVEIRDLTQGGKPRVLSGGIGDPLVTAQFSADGGSLVTIHMDNPLAKIGQLGSNVKASAFVWDANSGAKLLEVRGPQIASSAISADGRLLAVQFRGGRIELWNVPSGEQLFNWTLPQGEPSLTRSAEIAFTPDGGSLTAVENSSGEIQFLDLESVHRSLEKIGLGW